MLINSVEFEFLNLLLIHKVRFLIIGGYALRQYGYLREAGDLDIWVDVSGDNSSRLLNAIESSPYLSGNGLSSDDLSKPNKEIKLSGVLSLIEILTSLGIMDFEEADVSKEISLGKLPVISAKHLLIAKKFSLKLRRNEKDRLKDEADIKYLETYLNFSS